MTTKTKANPTNGKQNGFPKVRLKIEVARLDWGTLEDIQEIEEQIQAKEIPRFSKMRAILAHFVVDEDNEYVVPEEAARRIRSLNMDEIMPTFEKFTQGIQAVQLPPVNSGS